ncbi:flagellar hook-length control protein FliK [Breoghania sp.]|uniref:flagellar hook-length control protein FliK n=1 Tax=Breoghania sp. TaxID=2065378 RepID=UPI002AA7E4DF|nr:flagellar hook-length control protein FliK [Breoghania sp.]
MQVPQNLLNGAASSTDKTSGSTAAENSGDGGAFNELYKSVAEKDDGKGANGGRSSAEGRTGTPSPEHGHESGASALARIIGAEVPTVPARKNGSSDASKGLEGLEAALNETPNEESEAGQRNSAVAALMASASPISQSPQRYGGIASRLGPNSGNGSALQMAFQGRRQSEGQAPVSGMIASQTATAMIDQIEGGSETLFSRFAVKPEAVSLNGSSKTERITVGKNAADSIEVVRQETHFAPSQRIPPIQQVGQALSEALANGQATQSGRAPLSFGETGQLYGQTSGSAVKILEIRLQPQELGTVRVTMRIVEDRLQVDVRSANPQTVELLQKDKHMLDRLLHASGYKADSVSVQGISDDRSPFQITAGSNAQNANNATGQGEGRGANQFGGNAASGEGGQGSRQNGGEDTRHIREHRDSGSVADVLAKDDRSDGQELYL